MPLKEFQFTPKFCERHVGVRWCKDCGHNRMRTLGKDWTFPHEREHAVFWGTDSESYCPCCEWDNFECGTRSRMVILEGVVLSIYCLATVFIANRFFPSPQNRFNEDQLLGRVLPVVWVVTVLRLLLTQGWWDAPRAAIDWRDCGP